MPFPSPQGTQAAVRAMADACAAEGETHLLVYAGGAGALEAPRFALHRTEFLGERARIDVPAAALRSGPSLAKLLEDVALVRTLRRLHAVLRPDVVYAHHVEACAAALLAGARPLVFVAHTALAPELPTYLPAALRPLGAPLCARAGDALDVALARRADAVAAVAPALARRLAAVSGVAVHGLALPWAVPAPIDLAERTAARVSFGLAPGDEVVLYAGNLDAYQGLPCALAALARAAACRPTLRVLVATASVPHALRAALGAAGLGARARCVSLGDEASRRAVHAAADVALVPRGAEGGVPIKLLDALARGLPVVAQRRATAGLALDGVVAVCADDDPGALAAALIAALEAPHDAVARSARGRTWIAQAHSVPRFLETLGATRRGLVPRA